MKKRCFLQTTFYIVLLSLISCGNIHGETYFDEPDLVYVHYFVVPQFFPDGSPTTDAVAALKDYLLSLAGGYTELGKSNGGWSDPDLGNQTEEELSFMVSAPQIITAELTLFIQQNFQENEPYILVWEATSY